MQFAPLSLSLFFLSLLPLSSVLSSPSLFSDFVLSAANSAAPRCLSATAEPFGDQMGGCLSSYVEGVGGKGGRGEKRGGGLFDRRGGGVVTDPAELLAKVESGQGLTDEELQCLPGRMFLNGSSEVACLFTQQGRKGTNQDAMIVWEVLLCLPLIPYFLATPS